MDKITSFFGGKQEPEAPASEAPDAEEKELDLPTEVTDEDRAAQRDADIRKKLKEAATEQPPHPMNMFTYDTLFRPMNRVLMEGNMSQELQPGLQMGISRNAHNAQVSSQYHLVSAQQSNWELNLQMSGFSDVIAVGYNTQNRWHFMYQRVFKSGALLVAQFMAQPQAAMMGGPPGNFFGLMQYPWVDRGCSTMSLVRGQHLSWTHTQKLLRGLHVGTTTTYEFNTKKTSAAYGFQSQSPDKRFTWAGEVKDSGEWKLAFCNSDWANDLEMAAVLDYSEKRTGLASALSVGARKQLIGGGTLTACLEGFTKLKTYLELAFGGDRPGLNQIKVNYNLAYDINSGAAKHGISLKL